MAKKKVWITWMPGEGSSNKPDQVLKTLSQYGLEVSGNNWVDDLDKIAWKGLGEALLDISKVDMWLIAGLQENFESPSNRYGLSLVTFMVREGRGPSRPGGASFPIICLGLNFIPVPESMPTTMQSVEFISTTDQSWPAKVVAAAFGSKKVKLPEYRLNIHADPHFGQWFEIGPPGRLGPPGRPGPREENWMGIMFGVSEEAVITHQGVGPRGQIPSRTVLEYPIQDMKAQVGETEFTAWAVQNKLGPEDSYYVKVDGFPARIIFGGHPGDDQAEVFVITLK
ncbi:MAG: hypothetical protein QME81_10590 [bacterium]|nr:hypothetical protein [bacterium]